MISGRRHFFHIVVPSVWPISTAYSAFFFLSGMCFYMHRIFLGKYFLLVGFIALALCIFFWFGDIIKEGTNTGYHTKAVCSGLIMGFLLLIVSEFMLFFGFFWGFFHVALSPSFAIGGVWPPVGIIVIPVADFPLYNTTILLISGLAITWTHRGLSIGSNAESILSIIITLVLGFLFISFQFLEYLEASFSIDFGAYASAFYMLTGLHGSHVIAGVIFIFVCFVRILFQHFTVSHYLGFMFATWYWHFVDIVWIFLFGCVYTWGSL